METMPAEVSILQGQCCILHLKIENVGRFIVDRTLVDVQSSNTLLSKYARDPHPTMPFQGMSGRTMAWRWCMIPYGEAMRHYVLCQWTVQCRQFGSADDLNSMPMPVVPLHVSTRPQCPLSVAVDTWAAAWN